MTIANFDTLLAKYADVIITKGINVQKRPRCADLC